MPQLTPVRLRYRDDGWTPGRQRRYVAQLAATGHAGKAARGVGMTEQSAARLRRRPGAASFRRACELTVAAVAAIRPAARSVLHSYHRRLPSIVSMPAAERLRGQPRNRSRRRRLPRSRLPYPGSQPAMDLDQLIHREGVERLRAAEAASAEARESHLALAAIFRDRIDFRRRTLVGEAGPAARSRAR